MVPQMWFRAVWWRGVPQPLISIRKAKLGGVANMASEQYRRDYAHHLIEQVNKGHMTRRQLLVRASVFGFSATVAGSLLSACGGSSTTDTSASPSAAGVPEPVMGGTAKVIISPSLTDIDPVTIYDQGGITLISQFCEYLIDLKDDMTLEGRLAESWEPNDTGDVWTFKLRQGIMFSDGSPFEAPDVVSTMDRLVDPKSGSAAQAALLGILSVGGTKAVDAYTVEFNLDQPFADFPYMVCTSSYNTVMLPRSYKGDWAKNPVGHGSMAPQGVRGQAEVHRHQEARLLAQGRAGSRSCPSWTRSTGSWSPTSPPPRCSCSRARSTSRRRPSSRAGRRCGPTPTSGSTSTRPPASASCR